MEELLSEYVPKLDFVYLDKERKALLALIGSVHEHERTTGIPEMTYDFQQWRHDTVAQIKEGHKLAAGYWATDKYDKKQDQLWAACILRMKSRLPCLTAEINWIGADPRLPQDKSTGVKRDLVELVCEKLARHGFSRVTAQVGDFEDEDLKLLMSQPLCFKVEGHLTCQTREKTVGFYQLEHELPRAYTHDPFDPRLIVDWLREDWGFIVQKEDDTYLLPFTAAQGPLGVTAQFQTTDSLADVDETRTSGDVRVVLVREEPAVEERARIDTLRERSILVVSPSSLKRLCGNPDVDLVLLKKPPDGILVSIREEYYGHYRKKLEEQAAATLAYLDGGVYGAPCAPGGDKRLIFFADSTKEHGQVLGYGFIETVESGKASDVWDRHGAFSQFKQADWTTYRGLKTTATSFVFTNLETFDSPRPVTNPEFLLTATTTWKYLSAKDILDLKLTPKNLVT